ncbi:hypothetical protein COY26_01395 [Candidatus Woesearchaeota archaeon CG_4_10_14_0_2_um_filter_33_10]|nr:MAG: hypothetical protein AUJ83_03885 [Candidatus Woesearchaeota archaeon CG1_02_33_12]PIN79169.1 MAG: hypothetical protein COV14_00630 [Candidatus Woesearchaeota archaeon CG10_big_fil_rev_8_21_14_0_10_33_12]PIU72248.1 MAG: hypothetical protein COS79_03885 [Candidatus Woesearchaeota archaeon CG06_land_8_20_14_3_00_33_13]PIZ53633.1 MAG: hypothetical protein COY26_01395 [Candidatus Woesearchaeota archaeon CG_4_10_14_0_2_um_filter_33_10]
MIIKNKLILLVLLAITLPIADAVSIGVSPGNVMFDNMLKGGYAERTVKVTTNSNEDIIARLDVSGEIADWLRLEPDNKTFMLSSAKPYELKLIIETPDDARSDSYSGNIEFIIESFGDISGRAGGFVKPGVRLIISAVVSDKEIRTCNSGAFDFDDIEIGFPLKLSLTVANDGNVRIKPKISFDIWDQNQEKLVMSESFSGSEILPTTQEQITKTFSNNLEIGQYWANVDVDECGSSSLLTFSVVEKGGIVDNGVFEGITNKPWVYVEEPVEIKATFKNNGPRTVYAKFMGDVKLDNKIVEVIETEEIDVLSQETADFISYFTPDKPGRYVVSGRIIYNRKLSYEKASVINANYPTEIGQGIKFLPLVIYIIIIVTILFLARSIIKTKRRKF